MARTRTAEGGSALSMCPVRFALVALNAICIPGAAAAGDGKCNDLLESGQKLICDAHHPNWRLELICDSRGSVSSSFTRMYYGEAGEDYVAAPGTVSFSSANPWVIATSHGVAGSIAHTPGACLHVDDRLYDYTMTTLALPNGNGKWDVWLDPYVCCRIENSAVSFDLRKGRVEAFGSVGR